MTTAARPPAASVRVLPHNLEAEASVIGALMLDRNAIGKVVGILRPDDFYLDHHAQIYQAALSLHGRKEPIDLVTLGRELAKMKVIERIGGQAFLAELESHVPTAANVDHYARLVVDTATKRRMIHAADRLSAQARDDGTGAAELLGAARAAIFDLTERLVSGKPQVTRVGLGYRAEFSTGVVMGLERVRESRGEVHGELYIRAPVGSKHLFPDGHLFGARFNVSSLTARTSVARYLSSRLPADWPDMLERFCMEVLRTEREGADFTTVGANEQEVADRWLLRPLLLRGKSTILYGAGGSWKSTIGAACAVSIATGLEVVPGWITHLPDQPPTARNVLVLDWEDGSASWNDRIRYISIGAGQGSPEVHYVSMARPLADELERVAAFVSQKSIDLLIVDSVGLASGTQREGESPAEGAFRLFAALRELKTTNLLIDHVAGAELGLSAPTSKPYGSVYKVNLARAVFEVRSSERGLQGGTEILLLNTKTNTKLIPPQQLRALSEGGRILFMQWALTAPELKKALPRPPKKEKEKE